MDAILTSQHVCHAACQNATREECTCPCGGRFHGQVFQAKQAKVRARASQSWGGPQGVFNRLPAVRDDVPLVVANRPNPALAALSTDDYLDAFFGD